MGCKKYSSWLPMFADCLLSPRQQAELERHLISCPECRKEAELYQRVAECCCHLPKVELPCDFFDRLSFRLQAECEKPEPKIFLWRMPLMAGSLTAAALLAVLLISTPKLKPTPQNSLTGFPRGHYSQIDRLAPLLNPPSATAFGPELKKSPKPQTVAAQAPAMAVQPATLENETPIQSVPEPALEAKIPEPASNPVEASRRGLLQDAGFIQSGQLVPAYTVPHALAPRPVDPASETAGLMSNMSSTLPSRQKPECLVVRNSEQLLNLISSTQPKTPLFTELDWNKQMLAAIFFNPGEHSGYRILLDTIEQMPEKIVIFYRLQRPEVLMPASEMTPPTLLVVLPHSDLPVEFQEKY